MCRDDGYIGTWRNPETKQMVAVWREDAPMNPRDENQTPMWHIHTVESPTFKGIDDGDFTNEKLTDEAADYIRKGGLVIPVYRKGYYDAISFNAGERITRIRDIPEQNSGDGFGFLSKKELHNEYGKAKNRVKLAVKYLTYELKEYAAYVNDEVFRVVNLDADGEETDITILYEDYENHLRDFKFTEEMKRIETTTYTFVPKKSA